MQVSYPARSSVQDSVSVYLLHHREHDPELALHPRPNHNPLAPPAPHQCPHERNVPPLGYRQPTQSASSVWNCVGVLLGGAGLAGEGALVDLEARGRGEAEVGGDAVAGGERDEVAGDEDVAELG